MLSPGPVTWVELVAAGRRWQTFALRAGLVFLLLTVLTLICLSYQSGVLLIGGTLTLQEFSQAGANFAEAVLGLQLGLVLMAAPAITASAVCLDKSRGNLTLLMTTHLRPSEFILGKLLGRLTPVLGLIIASVPVLFIASLMGGIDGESLILGYTVVTSTAIATCALTLWISVHVNRTQEAITAAYLVLGAWAILLPACRVGGVFIAAPALLEPLRMTSPIFMLDAATASRQVIGREAFIVYAAVALAIAAICTLLAIVQLRRALLRFDRKPHRARKAVFFRRRNPRLLDENPLRWYERYRRRPGWAAQFLKFVYLAATVICVGVVYSELTQPRSAMAFFGGSSADAIVPILIFMAHLVVAVRAVTALADEKSRGSLDVLATTPLSTGSILWSKWRAAFAPMGWLMLCPVLLVALEWALHQENQWSRRQPNEIAGHAIAAIMIPLAAGAGLTSLGLFLALQIRRFATAVGVTIAAYVLIAVGWIFLCQTMGFIRFDDVWVQYLSPPAAAAFSLKSIAQPWRSSTWGVTLVVTIIYLGMAAYFYWLARIIATRRMGRIHRTESRPIPIEPPTDPIMT